MGRLRRPWIPEVCDGLFDALDAEARGDPDAVERWMCEARLALMSALARFVRPGHDPDDLASELLSAAVRIHRLAGRPEIGGARWISVAAAYLAERRHRRRGRLAACDSSGTELSAGDVERAGTVRRNTSDPARSVADALDLEEAIRRFNAALWKLPQPEARILQLSLVHGLTITEIQEHLDRWIRAETGGNKTGPGWDGVKKRLAKARQMLALVLAGEDLADHYPRLAFRRDYATPPTPCQIEFVEAALEGPAATARNSGGEDAMRAFKYMIGWLLAITVCGLAIIEVARAAGEGGAGGDGGQNQDDGEAGLPGAVGANAGGAGGGGGAAGQIAHAAIDEGDEAAHDLEIEADGGVWPGNPGGDGQPGHDGLALQAGGGGGGGGGEGSGGVQATATCGDDTAAPGFAIATAIGGSGGRAGYGGHAGHAQQAGPGGHGGHAGNGGDGGNAVAQCGDNAAAWSFGGDGGHGRNGGDGGESADGQGGNSGNGGDGGDGGTATSVDLPGKTAAQLFEIPGDGGDGYPSGSFGSGPAGNGTEGEDGGDGTTPGD